MTNKHYILIGQAIQEVGLLEWAAWFEKGEGRIVKREDLPNGLTVSTVFLGLDHNWSDKGPPLLFETMVFGLPGSEPMDRYPTWDKAMAGHRKMVKKYMKYDITQAPTT